MTKIASKPAYPDKNPLSDNDFLVGTNGDTIKKETKSFPVHALRDYLMQGLTPETGGTLKVTELVYEGILMTPEAVANQLDPNVIVQRYEVLIFNINGDKYQLKLQNVVLGVLQDDVTADDFIPISLVAENLSESISFYKGYNSTTGREEHYSIGSVGFSITKELDGLNETGRILLEQTQQTNLGTGQVVYKGFNNTSKKQEFYSIGSNTQIVQVVGNTIMIDTPSTASIPALYVNDLYIPTYNDWLVENKLQNSGTAVLGFIFRGKGTISQPFTNNTVYPLAGGSPTTTPNTAIQNALDGDSAYDFPYSYVGIGSRLSPERVGQKIVVQNNIAGYNFLGDLGYSRLDIEFLISSNITSTGMLFDLDNATHFNTLSDSITIRTTEGVNVVCTSSDGFNNSGTNVATNNFRQSRVVNLLGEGTIVFTDNNITKYIINSDALSTGNNNDGNLTFNITCKLRADYQGLVKIGGVSRVYSYRELQSSYSSITVNPALKAFLFLGGQFRSLEGSKIFFSGARNDGFVFTPTGGFTPNMVGKSASLVSENTITNLFNKTNNNNASLTFNNSDSSVQLLVTNIFESTNLWNVTFNKNIFESGTIDNTKADLTNGNTMSVTNSIGTSLIENLIVFPSKANAIALGYPYNSAFIKRNVFNAGSFIVGVEYKIVTVGTTNFTLIGASANTVGLFFTATGVGSGTGTASLETREILT